MIMSLNNSLMLNNVNVSENFESTMIEATEEDDDDT